MVVVVVTTRALQVQQQPHEMVPIVFGIEFKKEGEAVLTLLVVVVVDVVVNVTCQPAAQTCLLSRVLQQMTNAVLVVSMRWRWKDKSV